MPGRPRAPGQADRRSRGDADGVLARLPGDHRPGARDGELAGWGRAAEVGAVPAEEPAAGTVGRVDEEGDLLPGPRLPRRRVAIGVEREEEQVTGDERHVHGRADPQDGRRLDVGDADGRRHAAVWLRAGRVDRVEERRADIAATAGAPASAQPPPPSRRRARVEERASRRRRARDRTARDRWLLARLQREWPRASWRPRGSGANRRSAESAAKPRSNALADTPWSALGTGSRTASRDTGRSGPRGTTYRPWLPPVTMYPPSLRRRRNITYSSPTQDRLALDDRARRSAAAAERCQTVSWAPGATPAPLMTEETVSATCVRVHPLPPRLAAGRRPGATAVASASSRATGRHGRARPACSAWTAGGRFGRSDRRGRWS